MISLASVAQNPAITSPSPPETHKPKVTPMENDQPGKKGDDPSAQDTAVGLVMIVGVIALVFWLFSGGDRAVVIRCIEAVSEATRGIISDSEYRNLLWSVENASEVEIQRREDFPFGRVMMTSLEFTIDGRPNRQVCAM